MPPTVGRTPTAEQFVAAIQHPGTCFSDPTLRRSTAQPGMLGVPKAYAGQFGVVFPMTSPDGERYAVKCFTHRVTHLGTRYQQIGRHLSTLEENWSTTFDYQPTGIRVQGERHPLLRMNWVDAHTLIDWLAESSTTGSRIAALADRFEALAGHLIDVSVAHGDLQHGNILVEKSGRIRLVDYDGMFVPGLEGDPPHEIGHPNYQSPRRDRSDFGPAVDNFSAWLIFLSLKAIAADKNLFDQFNPTRDDYLLLDREDLSDPASSQRMATLRQHGRPDVRALAERVERHLRLRPRDVPPLGASAGTGATTADSTTGRPTKNGTTTAAGTKGMPWGANAPKTAGDRAGGVRTGTAQTSSSTGAWGAPTVHDPLPRPAPAWLDRRPAARTTEARHVAAASGSPASATRTGGSKWTPTPSRTTPPSGAPIRPRPPFPTSSGASTTPGPATMPTTSSSSSSSSSSVSSASTPTTPRVPAPDPSGSWSAYGPPPTATPSAAEPTPPSPTATAGTPPLVRAGSGGIRWALLLGLVVLLVIIATAVVMLVVLR